MSFQNVMIRGVAISKADIDAAMLSISELEFSREIAEKTARIAIMEKAAEGLLRGSTVLSGMEEALFVIAGNYYPVINHAVEQYLSEKQLV